MPYRQEVRTDHRIITSRIVSAMQSWLDSYLVWHSPQLAVAALQAMADARRTQATIKNTHHGSALMQCCPPTLVTGCAGAVHKPADV